MLMSFMAHDHCVIVGCIFNLEDLLQFRNASAEVKGNRLRHADLRASSMPPLIDTSRRRSQMCNDPDSLKYRIEKDDFCERKSSRVHLCSSSQAVRGERHPTLLKYSLQSSKQRQQHESTDFCTNGRCLDEV